MRRILSGLVFLLVTLSMCARSGPAQAQAAQPEAKNINGYRPMWWKEAVVYQIYPRSFKDSNGDGIGDLKGITCELDYLQGLGVNVIWLSPHFDSPNADNGYDIRDYRKVMAEFGTMADFDEMLAGIKQRHMRLIIDLVVNHTATSTAGLWRAGSRRIIRYRDYYIWRDGKPNPAAQRLRSAEQLDRRSSSDRRGSSIPATNSITCTTSRRSSPI